jgi:predicted nucleic acid-binding protein
MDTLVFDTAAVLNFGHRGDLGILIEKLSKHYNLLTTHGVVAELTDPKRKDFYRAFLAARFKIQTASAVPFDLAALGRLSQTIDHGEITVMALAKELNAVAVLDDRAARREAARLRIKMTGTLGLLQEAAKKKWMTEADCLARVTQLCDSGFSIPRSAPHQTFAEYLHSIQ